MELSAINKKKNQYLALILSLVPGLSHLYLGKRKKAAVLFVIDAGLILGLAFSRSYLMKIIIVNIYIFTFLPASLETWEMARDRETRISTDSRWYTVILLLTTGFNALPLLWQNERFSRRFKITWTIIVPILAAAFFFILVTYWDRMEEIIRDIFSRI